MTVIGTEWPYPGIRLDVEDDGNGHRSYVLHESAIASATGFIFGGRFDSYYDALAEAEKDYQEGLR